MPQISVLMGIYNCADTLEEAVNCIINQTFTDWELIMCDDCSNDNTYKVAKKIAESDSRIKLIKNERNLTLAPTLNRCAKCATGKYIARMDGDDICDLNRFHMEYDFLENHPEYAVVSCSMILYDENGEYGLIKHDVEPTVNSFFNGSPFCHAGCMIRKNVFDELKGYDEISDVERVEDYDLWFRMYSAGYKGYNIDRPLYSMRDDRNAVKRRKMKYRINETKLLLRICNGFNLGFNKKILSIVPILKGLMPMFIYKFAHKIKASK